MRQLGEYYLYHASNADVQSKYFWLLHNVWLHTKANQVAKDLINLALLVEDGVAIR